MGTILITGCAGEVGSSLARHFSTHSRHTVVGTDVRSPDQHLARHFSAVVVGDISDPRFVSEFNTHYTFDTIFHLAGILSSTGEKNPLLAHGVNVTGTLNVLELARAQTERSGIPVTVVFTSTIAVYGIATLQDKTEAGTVAEEQHLQPLTMYGANKLYCEHLGHYYSKNFGMLGGSSDTPRIDFRCLRYPGLLNAHTLPTGGTSDYAPEMVHSFAVGKDYTCFVRPDSRIPFMMMPDALRALIELSQAPREKLTRSVYNVSAFSPSAEEIATLLQRHFPTCSAAYAPHPERQRIVDSWPEAIDDSAARRDWGWVADYSFASGFEEYLVPAVKEQYVIDKAVNS